MVDGETVVAERAVALNERDTVQVRISEHRHEEFWRVQVHCSRRARDVSSTTVGTADNFIWHLIRRAVDGEQTAWQELARWGHVRLARSSPGPRFTAG